MRSLFKMMKGFGYVLLITPPHAIDLTVTHRQKQGELAKQPLLIVMVVELLIRTALILLVAVTLESLTGNTTYETYMLDTVFSMLVVLGALHSFAYFLFLGYLRPSIGLKLGMRLYRFFRNLCYAAIPGQASDDFLLESNSLIDKNQSDKQNNNEDIHKRIFCHSRHRSGPPGS